MYRLTFQMPEENLNNAKARGKYPYPIGGELWEQGDTKVVEDLSPYYEGERAKKHVHEFLLIEVLNEDSEATNAE